MPETRDFNTVASQWDENPGRLQLAEDVSRSLVQKVLLNPGMDILDFGCGTGLITLHLQPLVRSVTSVDTSSGMLEVLRTKVGQQGIGNVRPVLLDLENGGELEGHYHAIVSSMTLHHVPDTAALLSQFFALLLPGGVLALADLDPEGGLFHEDPTGVFHQGFDRSALSNLYRQAGFQDVEECTAAQAQKTDSRGVSHTFTVFLMTGRKK